MCRSLLLVSGERERHGRETERLSNLGHPSDVRVLCKEGGRREGLDRVQFSPEETVERAGGWSGLAERGREREALREKHKLLLNRRGK